jgi:hypothetical protein
MANLVTNTLLTREQKILAHIQRSNLVTFTDVTDSSDALSDFYNEKDAKFEMLKTSLLNMKNTKIEH